MRAGYPIRIYANKNEFTYAVQIKLGGFASGGKYFYSLGYIKAYTVDHADSGIISYNIGTPGEISAIEIVEPHIYPVTLHDDFPIDIRITSSDDTLIVYDTGNVAFEPNDYPLRNNLDLSAGELPAGATYWKLTLTLKKTGGFTPEFRRLNLTVAA